MLPGPTQTPESESALNKAPSKASAQNQEECTCGQHQTQVCPAGLLRAFTPPVTSISQSRVETRCSQTYLTTGASALSPHQVRFHLTHLGSVRPECG